MSLKSFIYLPESDDAVANIAENINMVIEKSIQLTKLLREKGGSELFYDSNNIKTLFDKCEVLVGVHLNNPRNQLRLGLNKTAQDINLSPIKDGNCIYILWNLDKFSVEYVPSILAETAERIFQFPTDSYIFLNIGNAIDADRSQILVFKDHKPIKSLPDKFAHIDFVTDEIELELWLSTYHIKSFSLRDESRFEKTNYVYTPSKRAIYREVSTGNYWYFDFYHKDNKIHYEVFDKTGKEHLGEANEQGILDSTKIDSNKHINQYL